ncbi:hydrophobin family protein [Streptomyces celluloflavus]|uniref:hydrophobin family protein n=1 Tax=Streptomyces celluloflavus TaxID=58344 RepID=UPI00378F5E40
MSAVKRVVASVAALGLAGAAALLGAATAQASAAAPDGTRRQSGTLECCQAEASADEPVVSEIAGLLGLTIPPDTIVGVACSPIAVIGSGGNSCTGDVLECAGTDTLTGLIAVDCTPYTAAVRRA